MLSYNDETEDDGDPEPSMRRLDVRFAWMKKKYNITAAKAEVDRGKGEKKDDEGEVL